MIDTAIKSRLDGFAGLSALVGDRVYPVRLRQGVKYPAVSYHRIHAERESAMGADSDIVFSRWQFSTWAESIDTARAVANQVRQAMQRWRGTVNGVVIDDTFVEDGPEIFDDGVGVTGGFHVITEAEIIYRE